MWLAQYEALKAHLEANDGAYPAQGDAAGLGTWINNQRTAYKKPEGDPARLAADRIALLEQLPGWTWNAHDEKWQSKYEALRAHLDANGGAYPARGDASGLGNWISDQRTAYKKPEGDPARLAADRIAPLEQLPGWTWNAQDEKWPSKYEALRAHLDANDGEYPVKGDPSGLGTWIHNQRKAYKKPEGDPKRLTADRVALLEQLPGWTWKGRFKKPTKTAAATCSQPQPKKKPRVIETSSSDETMGDVDTSDNAT